MSDSAPEWFRQFEKRCDERFLELREGQHQLNTSFKILNDALHALEINFGERLRRLENEQIERNARNRFLRAICYTIWAILGLVAGFLGSLLRGKD